MEWQPIETAPVGEWLLCRRAGQQLPFVIRQCAEGEWEFADGEDEDGTLYLRCWNEDFNPTHWMPIPVAPVQHEKG
jgi:hypothetical protein